MASNLVQSGKYDLSFAQQSGTEIGLMLAQKNGVKLYEESADSVLSPQYFTGAPDYANLPPEKEFQIAQSDWRHGFGQEYFDSSKNKSYYYGLNVDGRFKDMLIAGPLATSVTKPSLTAPTITNADMELTTGWTNGARSSGYANTGTIRGK